METALANERMGIAGHPKEDKLTRLIQTYLTTIEKVAPSRRRGSFGSRIPRGSRISAERRRGYFASPSSAFAVGFCSQAAMSAPMARPHLLRMEQTPPNGSKAEKRLARKL